VRWDRGSTKPAFEYKFHYGKGYENYELGTFFFLHKRNLSAVKKFKFVSEGMLSIMLRGYWCDIIVLNINFPTEDKIDDLKVSFYEELECVVSQFCKYGMKIMLGVLSARISKEDSFKWIVGNKSFTQNQ
jgi:hypothetical protein